MNPAPWTRLVGAQDIYRHLRARAPWGALIWALALAILLELDGVGPDGSPRGPLMVAVAGGLLAGVVMAWQLPQRHQWTGLTPYLLTTLGILLVILPMTLFAHWIWGFASESVFRSIVGLGSLGVLLQGVGATDWMTRYRGPR